MNRLMKENLWYVVCGDEERPTEGAAAQKEHDEKQNRALTLIAASINDKLVCEISQCRSGTEAWNRLEDKCHSSAELTTIKLKEQLYKAKLPEGGDLGDHLNQIEDLFLKLAQLNVDHSEKEVVLTTMNSLNNSYRPFVSNVLARHKDNLPEFKELCDMLLEEEAKKHSGHGSSSTNPVKTQPNVRAGKNPALQEVYFCVYCNKRGHTIELCRKRTGSCFHCGRKGHKIEQCFDRK